jgi:hypothetical protein
MKQNTATTGGMRNNECDDFPSLFIFLAPLRGKFQQAQKKLSGASL